MRAPGPSTWRCRRGTTIALNSWPAVCARITPRIACCCWREWRRPEGHHQQAMTYLRSARGKLLGMQSTNSSETPTVGGVLAADNPFIGVSQTSAPTRTASAYGQYMPWQVAQSAAAPRFHAAGDPAHRSAGGHRPDADAASGGHHDGVAAGENRQLAAGGEWTCVDATANRAPAS